MFAPALMATLPTGINSLIARLQQAHLPPSLVLIGSPSIKNCSY